MGRPPCCNEDGVKKGPWTPEEDQKLIDYISQNGRGTWRTLPKHAGLNRCGKSCRLRWENYLRPDIKRGKFTEEEERLIINLHSVLGNKWAKIATHLPGRTDNEIKNYWNTNIRKKLLKMGIDPETHKPRTDFNHLMNLSQLLDKSNLGTSMSPWNNPFNIQADISTQLVQLQLLQNMLQLMNSPSFVNMGNPSLLGNQYLNPLDAFLNGKEQIEEPILTGQEHANSGLLLSQTHSDSSEQNIFNSGSEKESDPNPDNLGYNKNTIPLQENQKENLLPALVSSSPRTNIFSQMDDGSFDASTFEAWEKFLIDDVDDETSGSYWNDILDLASTSASPISW